MRESINSGVIIVSLETKYLDIYSFHIDDMSSESDKPNHEKSYPLLSIAATKIS